MLRHALIVFAGLFGAGTVHAAATCPWLGLYQVDKALPELAPWEVASGGPGLCTFDAHRSRSYELSVTQTVHKSAAAALESVQTGSDNMRDDHAVVFREEPDLGKGAYSYTSDGVFLSLSGSSGRLEIGTTLRLEKAISPAQYAAARQLTLAALRQSNDEKVLAAASTCPYFDDALIKQLVPGAEIRVTGSDCDASANGVFVQLAIAQDSDRDRLGMALRNSARDCNPQPLPQLGDGASLAACADGTDATVRFIKDDRFYTLSFVPQRKPTAQERATLVKLAEKLHPD